MESPEADAWGSGAYLTLVARLFERLVPADLTLEELQAVSKMLADQRRAHTRVLDAARSSDKDRRGTRARGEEDTGSGLPLPPRFGEMVEQIYGVTPARESHT
jgi:hypothetical protein